MNVLIPVKLLNGKRRLSNILSDDQRRAFSLAMLLDLIIALKQVGSIEKIILVGDCEELFDIARRYNIEVFSCFTKARTLNNDIESTCQFLRKKNKQHVMIVHADIPNICTNTLKRMIAQYLKHKTMLLVTDSNANGSNILMLNLSYPFLFNYGDNSFQSHKQTAASLNIQYSCFYSPGLSFDIDEECNFVQLYENKDKLKKNSYVNIFLEKWSRNIAKQSVAHVG